MGYHENTYDWRVYDLFRTSNFERREGDKYTSFYFIELKQSFIVTVRLFEQIYTLIKPKN